MGSFLTHPVNTPPSPTRWHKRYHPLLQQWVVYAAHRNARPWSFDRARAPTPAPVLHDPTCYLCPGNARAGGQRNPDYDGPFAFDNDFPVVGPDAPAVAEAPGGVYRKAPARGLARVLCYHPRHDASTATVAAGDVRAVFAALRSETRELSRRPEVRSVFPFENKGQLVGVSNPHPHCQVYATDFVFDSVARGLSAAEAHARERDGADLFGDILAAELADGAPRVVAANAHAVAFVPYFARWAYEVMIVPRAPRATLASLSPAELDALADLYHEVARRYDGLFGEPFPYVLSVPQAPFRENGEEDATPGYRVHVWLQPPLRQPGLKKFPAGPEWGGGNFMADTLPEDSAAQLRAVQLPAARLAPAS